MLGSAAAYEDALTLQQKRQLTPRSAPLARSPELCAVARVWPAIVTRRISFSGEACPSRHRAAPRYGVSKQLTNPGVSVAVTRPFPSKSPAQLEQRVPL